LLSEVQTGAKRTENSPTEIPSWGKWGEPRGKTQRTDGLQKLYFGGPPCKNTPESLCI